MKVKFDKIVQYNIRILEYLSDEIFKFVIDIPDLVSIKWKQYEDQMNNKVSKSSDFLDQEIIGKRYTMLGNRDELMKINFKHCYKADHYYSNGQKIVSVIKNSDDYELGIHKSNYEFINYFYQESLFGSFSLENFHVQKYTTHEKVESEIVNQLSLIQLQIIPLEHDSNIDQLEIRKIHISDYILKYKEKETHLTLLHNGPTFDVEFRKFLEEIKPRKAICCFECLQFQFSGMSHDMSGGFTGYCNLMRNQLIEKTVKQSITNITNWCSKFERK